MIYPFESTIQRLNNQGVKNVVSNPSVATSAASKHLIIDLISLHVLFFQCRSCDSTLENCFLKRSYHSNAQFPWDLYWKNKTYKPRSFFLQEQSYSSKQSWSHDDLGSKNKCNMIYNLHYLNFCSKVDRVNYMCHVWVVWLWINIRKAFLPNRWNKWKNHGNDWCLDKQSQVSSERKNFLRAHAIGNHCKGCSWQTASYMCICFWLG